MRLNAAKMHGNPSITSYGHSTRITTETARQFNVLRWNPAESNPVKLPEPVKLTRNPADWKLKQLKRVMRHIRSIHNQLDEGVDPKGVLSLTAALDKLLVQARILRGESLPPVLKAPQNKRVASSMPVPE